jgi:hypothetical protein
MVTMLMTDPEQSKILEDNLEKISNLKCLFQWNFFSSTQIFPSEKKRIVITFSPHSRIKKKRCSLIFKTVLSPSRNRQPKH